MNQWSTSDTGSKILQYNVRLDLRFVRMRCDIRLACFPLGRRLDLRFTVRVRCAIRLACFLLGRHSKGGKQSGGFREWFL